MNCYKNLRSNAAAINKSQYEDSKRSSTESNESDSEESEYPEYPLNNKRLRTITLNGASKDRRQIERKPTRVPNFKIQNRNAVLARENRKRKKEIMESLEKNVSTLHAENRSLSKIMKFKDSKIDQLVKEIKYLKSVILNRTEIVSILKSLPQIPATSRATKTIETNDQKLTTRSTSSETLSCSSLTSNNYDDMTFEWEEILKNPFSTESDFSDIAKMDEVASSKLSPEVVTEHNYSYYEKYSAEDESVEKLPGVCLHINSGRVSLEFCSICHHNSANPQDDDY